MPHNRLCRYLKQKRILDRYCCNAQQKLFQQLLDLNILTISYANNCNQSLGCNRSNQKTMHRIRGIKGSKSSQSLL